MSEKFELVCDREGCVNRFTKSSWNQRFCSNICTRIYTNERILAQYHEKKNKKMTGRVCAKKNCHTLLSQYNEGVLCGVHEREAQLKKLRKWGILISSEEDYEAPY